MRIVIVAFILFSLALATVARGDSTCDTLDAIGMDKVSFDSQAYDWSDMPRDLKLVRFVYLNDPSLPDDQVRAVEYEYSESAREVWVIGYNSMAVTTVNGHTGQHDVCVFKLDIDK